MCLHKYYTVTSTCPCAVHKPYLYNNIYPRRHYCLRACTIRLGTMSCTAARGKIQSHWSMDEKIIVDPETMIIRFGEQTMYLSWHYLFIVQRIFYNCMQVWVHGRRIGYVRNSSLQCPENPRYLLEQFLYKLQYIPTVWIIVITI